MASRSRSLRRRLPALGLASALAVSAACSEDDEVSSDEEARQAYQGLDGLVETSVDLGFRGMNSTNGATIPAQMAMGLKAGVVVVTGKVDQGASDNKNMDLALDLNEFSNDGQVRYESPAGDGKPLPRLVLSLKKIPTGTLSGTLTGDFAMAGELKGGVTLNLTINASLEPDPTAGVRRKPGTTTITGTAVSSAGTYDVQITR